MTAVKQPSPSWTDTAAPRITRRPATGRRGWSGIARALAPLAALAVLAGAALAVTTLTGRAHRGQATASPRSAKTLPGSAGAMTPGGALAPGRSQAPPGPAYHAPGLLTLVPGTQLVNGLYLSYPHSEAGAVSAAVEFTTELGSTLDPDRAATIARLTADPSFGGAPEAAAQGVVSTRRQLGLAAAGPLPPGAAVSLVPAMFQVRNVTLARLTVLLLFDYTAIVPAGIREHLGAEAVRLHWTSSGWRLLKPSGPGVSGLIATPGTAAAAAKGWKAMTSGV